MLVWCVDFILGARGVVGGVATPTPGSRDTTSTTYTATIRLVSRSLLFFLKWSFSGNQYSSFRDLKGHTDRQSVHLFNTQSFFKNCFYCFWLSIPNKGIFDAFSWNEPSFTLFLILIFCFRWATSITRLWHHSTVLLRLLWIIWQDRTF